MDRVTLLAEKRLCFRYGLQIYSQSHCCAVLDHNAETAYGLKCSVSLRMPDLGHRVANISLVDLFNWNATQFRQNVISNWSIPTPRFSVVLELSLSCFEAFLEHLLECRMFLRGFACETLALLDRINPRFRQTAPFGSLFSRISKRHIWICTETHLASATMDGHAKKPLSATIWPLVKPQATAIAMLPNRRVLREGCREFIERWQSGCPPVPHSIHPKI